MLAQSLPLQVPGGPELVVLALILVPIVVLALIGFVLVRRLLDLPDPSRVNELEREVERLRERVEDVDAGGRDQRRDGLDDVDERRDGQRDDAFDRD